MYIYMSISLSTYLYLYSNTTHPYPVLWVVHEHLGEEVDRVFAEGGRRLRQRLTRPAREDGLVVRHGHDAGPRLVGRRA